MKKIVSAALAVCTLCASAAAAENPAIMLDNGVMETNVSAIADGSCVMLPLRNVMEALGYKVFFNEKTDEIIMLKSPDAAIAKLGSDTATVNGAYVKLDCPLTLSDERAMAPARLIKEITGMYVGYDRESNRIIISSEKTNNTKLDTGGVAVSENELLKNSDFEITDASSDDFGWTRYGQCEFEIYGDDAFCGSSRMLIKNRKSNYSGVGQDVTDILAENGPGTYRISAYMKTAAEGAESVGNNYGFNLKYIGTGDAKDIYVTKKVPISDKWSRVSLTAELSWSGDMSNALLYFEGTNTSDFNDYCIDMCSVEKID